MGKRKQLVDPQLRHERRVRDIIRSAEFSGIEDVTHEKAERLIELLDAGVHRADAAAEVFGFDPVENREMASEVDQVIEEMIKQGAAKNQSDAARILLEEITRIEALPVDGGTNHG